MDNIAFLMGQALLKWGKQHWMDRNLPWRSVEESIVRRTLVEALLVQTRAEAVAAEYSYILEGILKETDLDAVNVERAIMRAGKLGLPRLKQMALVSISNWLRTGTYRLADLYNQPGIGEYMWGMLATLWGEDAAPVDCNVQRVAQRVNGEMTPVQWLGELMLGIQPCHSPLQPFPKQYILISAILDIGATLCRMGYAPRCRECPLVAFCHFAVRGCRQLELGVQE